MGSPGIVGCHNVLTSVSMLPGGQAELFCVVGSRDALSNCPPRNLPPVFLAMLSPSATSFYPLQRGRRGRRLHYHVAFLFSLGMLTSSFPARGFFFPLDSWKKLWANKATTRSPLVLSPLLEVTPSPREKAEEDALFMLGLIVDFFLSYEGSAAKPSRSPSQRVFSFFSFRHKSRIVALRRCQR